MGKFQKNGSKKIGQGLCRLEFPQLYGKIWFTMLEKPPASSSNCGNVKRWTASRKQHDAYFKSSEISSQLCNVKKDDSYCLACSSIHPSNGHSYRSTSLKFSGLFPRISQSLTSCRESKKEGMWFSIHMAFAPTVLRKRQWQTTAENPCQERTTGACPGSLWELGMIELAK